MSITIASGDAAESNENHLRHVREHAGTVVELEAPDLYTAFDRLLVHREGAGRGDRDANATRRERPADPYRQWTAVLDSDDLLVSIALATGGEDVEEHFQYEQQYNGTVITLSAADLNTAFAQLLSRIREAEDAGNDLADRFAAAQAGRAAALAVTDNARGAGR
ncbi:hypothetical protein [Kitasatospora sp. NPDC057223]|uniref:hypothetical protein n=1 Tax=Kitasatospora sp. NPDC057223 TaxID=3346055 RepID=UPI00363FD72B